MPVLKERYFDKGIKVNIEYFSHNYGNYQELNIIGDCVKLAYEPTLNINKERFEKYIEIHETHKMNCGRGVEKDVREKLFSYKNNFQLANKYFNKYFKISDEINDIVEKYSKEFDGCKVIGLHYRGSDKNRVKWVTHITMEEYLTIVDYELKRNNYDKIYISSDEKEIIKEIKERYKSYKIITYKQNNYGIKKNNQYI